MGGIWQRSHRLSDGQVPQWQKEAGRSEGKQGFSQEKFRGACGETDHYSISYKTRSSGRAISSWQQQRQVQSQVPWECYFRAGRKGGAKVVTAGVICKWGQSVSALEKIRQRSHWKVCRLQGAEGILPAFLAAPPPPALTQCSPHTALIIYNMNLSLCNRLREMPCCYKH